MNQEQKLYSEDLSIKVHYIRGWCHFPGCMERFLTKSIEYKGRIYQLCIEHDSTVVLINLHIAREAGVIFTN